MAKFLDDKGNVLLEGFQTLGSPEKDIDFLKSKGIPNNKLNQYIQWQHNVSLDPGTLGGRAKMGFADKPVLEPDNSAFYLKNALSATLPPIAPFLMGNKEYVKDAKSAIKDLPGDLGDMPSGVLPLAGGTIGTALGLSTGPAAVVGAPAGAYVGTYGGQYLNKQIGKLLGVAEGDFNQNQEQKMEAGINALTAGIPGAKETGRTVLKAGAKLFEKSAIDQLVEKLGIKHSSVYKNLIKKAGVEEPSIQKQIVKKASKLFDLGKTYPQQVNTAMENLTSGMNAADEKMAPFFIDEAKDIAEKVAGEVGSEGKIPRTMSQDKFQRKLIKRLNNLFSTDVADKTNYTILKAPSKDVSGGLLSKEAPENIVKQQSWIPGNKLRYAKTGAYDKENEILGKAEAKVLQKAYESRRTDSQKAMDELYQFLKPLSQGITHVTQNPKLTKPIENMDIFTAAAAPKAAPAIAVKTFLKNLLKEPTKRKVYQGIINKADQPWTKGPSKDLMSLISLLQGANQGKQ